MQRHLLRHKVNRFECDCPDIPKALAKPNQRWFGHKERHLKLKHWGWIGCNNCEYIYKSGDDLSKHECKNNICDVCGFTFCSKEYLKLHLTNKYQRNETIFAC